jgi:hypothetical protein
LRTLLNAVILVATVAGLVVSFVALQRDVGNSPWLLLLSMFYFLGLVKVAQPFVLLRMPSRLRGVRAWEADSAAYRRLRVPQFGRLLRDTPLRYFNPAVYLAPRAADLGSLDRLAEAAEAAHFWAALLFTPCIVFVVLTGQWPAAVVFMLVQVVFNIYPILNLRMVRARLDRLAQRRQAQPERHTRAAPRGHG